MTMAKVRSKLAARKVQAASGRKAKGSPDKAIGLIRPREPKTTGSICIPDVAIYQAGHRKVRDGATHIVR